MSNIKILMTSIGSLVGTNFLACVERRRDEVCVIGVNSLADAANNFACDAVYLGPTTAESGRYLAFLHRLIAEEQPDLVLPGRDEDVYALALLRERETGLAARIAVGPSAIALMMLDKYATFEFARQHDLPFARTVSTDSPTRQADSQQLLEQVGFPLVAKPRRGFGSIGVFYVTNETQLAKALAAANYVIQEYIGDPADATIRARQLEVGVPLFFETPNVRQFGGQVQISSSGNISALFAQSDTQVLGRPAKVEKIEDPCLATLLERYAQCLAEAGWRGSLNVQCRRREKSGEFVSIELNGRMSGSSHARLVFGFDEIGALVDDFCAPKRLRRMEGGRAPRFILRSSSDLPVFEDDIFRLQNDGRWQRAAMTTHG